MIEQIRINDRNSNSSINRKASEHDYDCIFEKDERSGLYLGFINSNYNLNSPYEVIKTQLSKFDPLDYQESLRNILKEIDTELTTKGYISRCVVIIFKASDTICIAKAGGGIDLYGVCPPLFPHEDLAVSVFKVVERRWEAERDFFVGSGSAIPMIEQLDADSSVLLMTNPMKTNIERNFSSSIEDIIPKKFNGYLTKSNIRKFCDDIFESVYMNKTSSHLNAYLAFI